MDNVGCTLSCKLMDLYIEFLIWSSSTAIPPSYKTIWDSRKCK